MHFRRYAARKCARHGIRRVQAERGMALVQGFGNRQ